jgi:hypothetical protein
VGYIDANWVGDAIYFYQHQVMSAKLGGYLITWSSKQHLIVVLSSTKAKCQSQVKGYMESIWLNFFC